jgi:diguanylate cyclase (GGDEF)-like protein
VNRTDELPASRPFVVLVASDAEWSARSLDSILGPQGYAVLRANSGKQALDLAVTTVPDAIILDTKTRDLDGFEVCRRLREERRISPLTPVLLTASSPTTRVERLKAFASGAWEFFPQPIDGEVLLLQLKVFLSSKQDADRMRDENLLDTLTGLYSIRGLARRAREIGAEAYRLRVPLACVALSPTNPDQEDAGYLAAGESDPIIEHIGAVLRRSGRVSDAIGRFGHSEFGVVAPATDASGVLKLVDRLRAALEESPLRSSAAPRLGMKAGYHVVQNYAESPVDALEMLVRASTALHASLSDEAGNSVRSFDQLGSTEVS